MAHNINYDSRTGKYSFFSVKEKAWHGLGQIVSDYPTSEEAIRHAGLNFEVSKEPLYTKGKGLKTTEQGIEFYDSEIEVPNAFATVRDDNNEVLGVVGRDYQVVQNYEVFAFFDEIVGRWQRNFV